MCVGVVCFGNERGDGDVVVVGVSGNVVGNVFVGWRWCWLWCCCCRCV